MFFDQSLRWFGPADPVSLRDIRQAGAAGVVTALHELPNGAVWPVEAIRARQQLIARAGLRWNVVESVPVHEQIKTAGPRRDELLASYAQTLRHLGACGVQTVCYNFMPVLDWTRTDLAYELPDGARALRFDQTAFAAFDLHLLRRPGAAADYDEARQHAAQLYFDGLDAAGHQQLQRTILAGLPGAEEGYSLESFRQVLDTYADIGPAQLRANLLYFLAAVVPAAEQAGVRLCIHPDDPPRPILGLPRVLSTAADVEAIFRAVPSPHNGLTFCTGSFGVRPDNDLPAMFTRFADRVHFLHLRSTQREPADELSFHEAGHLAGDVDMYAVVRAAVLEMHRRQAQGHPDYRLPMRPDHGHQLLDDLTKKTNPGYSAIGRLRGLAELRGLELGIQRSLGPPAATSPA